MSTVRNHRVLAATLALLLISTGSAWAITATVKPQVSSAQPASAKPDVTTTSAAPATAKPSDADLNARIPLPEPLNLPPPTAKDVAAPTTTPNTAVVPGEQPGSTEIVNKPPAFVPGDPVAEKLYELVTTKLARFADRKGDREGIEAFYAARQYAPLWTDKGAVNDKAKAAIAYLAQLDTDALNPSDYPTPVFNADASPQALAEAELKLTDAVVTFARHAQNGRVHFSRVAGDIFYPQVEPDLQQVLVSIAKASDVAKALDANNPPQAGYKALKAKLAELRSQAGEEPKVVRIPDGQLLRPGMDDPRVPLMRKRFEITSEKSDNKYDDELVEAVKKFQTNAALEVDGVIGPNTLRILNNRRTRAETIDTVLANMERWRWMPRDLGKTYVMLNIPSFTLKVVNNGTTVWTTKVVVGKPDTPTPILTETMKFITVNPTWNVPPSIVYNEYLPALYQDPTVLARMGIKVTQNEDGSVHMYQPPGDANALGRIRFNFPNKFLVYQHDTPDKHLFERDTRAYSHGCMRVQDPLKYGEVLLSIVLPNEGYTQDRLRSMYADTEKEIPFPTPIPVHITYQTAFVDDSGKLILRDDIYGRDARTLAPLKEERQVADVPMDRRGELQASYARPSVQLPYGVDLENSRYASSSDGLSFFEMLFGGGRPQPPAFVGRRRYER
ncbi:MAG: L,D-transpeptidase family protein [Xanthobacteraceae bacterium]